MAPNIKQDQPTKTAAPEAETTESVSFPVHPDHPETLPDQGKQLVDRVDQLEQMVLELGDVHRSGSEKTGTKSESHVISCQLTPGTGVTLRERISTGTHLVGGLIMGEAKRTTDNVRGAHDIYPIQVFSSVGGTYIRWDRPAEGDGELAIGEFRVAR